MEKTIQQLQSKTNQLNKIILTYDVSFTLEIVPTLYPEEPVPCLAPSASVIKFCYETNTDIDIDLYLGKEA